MIRHSNKNFCFSLFSFAYTPTCFNQRLHNFFHSFDLHCFSTSIKSLNNPSFQENKNKVWWRTTPVRLFDYGEVSAEEKVLLKRQHQKIINDNRTQVHHEELNKLLNKQYFLDLEKRSFFYRFYDYLHKHLFYPRSHMIKFLNLIFKQSENENLRKCFKISSNDFCAKTYFFLLHVWIINCKINYLKAEGMKLLFWETIWDYFRFVLSNEKVSEFSYNSNLVNIQQYCFGFCLGLDESIEERGCGDLDGIWVSQLQYVLWMNIFKGNEENKNAKHLEELTVYTVKLLRFIDLIPKEYFYEAAFTWPSWDV